MDASDRLASDFAGRSVHDAEVGIFVPNQIYLIVFRIDGDGVTGSDGPVAGSTGGQVEHSHHLAEGVGDVGLIGGFVNSDVVGPAIRFDRAGDLINGAVNDAYVAVAGVHHVDTIGRGVDGDGVGTRAGGDASGYTCPAVDDDYGSVGLIDSVDFMRRGVENDAAIGDKSSCRWKGGERLGAGASIRAGPEESCGQGAEDEAKEGCHDNNTIAAGRGAGFAVSMDADTQN